MTSSQGLHRGALNSGIDIGAVQKWAHQKSAIFEPTYLLPHHYLIISKTYIPTPTSSHHFTLRGREKHVGSAKCLAIFVCQTKYTKGYRRFGSRDRAVVQEVGSSDKVVERTLKCTSSRHNNKSTESVIWDSIILIEPCWPNVHNNWIFPTKYPCLVNLPTKRPLTKRPPTKRPVPGGRQAKIFLKIDVEI